MPQTLEERVDNLEKKLAQLISQTGANSQNWIKTFGFSREDPQFDEMVRLGQEYRQSLKDHKADAGS